MRQGNVVLQEYSHVVHNPTKFYIFLIGEMSLCQQLEALLGNTEIT
jgi:hypothetical protein